MKLFQKIADACLSGGKVFATEMRNIFHDQGVMLFFFFLPLVYPVLYSLIYNPELVTEVPVVVIDSDRTAQSRDFVRKFGATQGAKVIGYATDLPDARKAVDTKKAFAILQIPAGFERKIGRSEQAPVILYAEMSLLLRYRSLLFSLTDLQMAEGADILASDVSNLGAATLAPDQDPMPIDGFALGNLESGFDSFIMPGVIILILQQCIVLAVAMLGGAKHENPGLIGYNPINRGPSVVVDMLAKGACYIVILALPMIWLLHYVPVIFQFPMCGNPVEIFAFVLPMVIASVFLGFVMQAFCSERESIFVIWVATSIIFLFLSGITWPRYAMSPFWSRISDLVPATWGLNGFILMNSNGASLSDVSWIWDKLWILALFYGLIAWAVQRFIVRPATAGK